MIFDIALFQYHLFRNLEQNVLKTKGAVPFRAAPSIRPESNMFLDVHFDSYVKFIQSTYRVDIDGRVFYFFFRNSKNKVDNTFCCPSSIEVVENKSGNCVTLFKFHYFSPHSDAILSQDSSEYDDVSDMKLDIVTVSDYIVNEFISKHL